MKIEEILALLLSSEQLPEDWDSQIREAYEYDMSVPTAKVSSLEQLLAQKDEEIARLKIHNYDLLMNGVQEETEDEEENEETEVEEDFTTDSLFADEEEDK